MRKLLLATVAVLGASIGVASVADAQTTSPAPGTVTVRLNGRFRYYGFYAADRDADNNVAAPGTAGTVNAAGQGTLTGTNKQANYGFAGFARLYPGFDGVAANGLKYGASLEIRQDQASGAGGGVYGSISQQNRARGALYFRREWGYIGTDQLGTIRLGTTDGPATLFATGLYENYDGGGVNGDIPGLVAPALQVTYPFATVGALYATNKAVYLSPQFLGFDFGVSYEPSTAGFSINNNCTSASPVGTNFVNGAGTFTAASGENNGSAGVGCDRLASTPVNGETSRRRNTVEAVLRYRGTFGGFGIAATAGYIGGGNVQDNQSGVAFNDNPFNGQTIRRNYQGLSVGQFGLALTYAGFSVGGHYQAGRFNGQWNLSPKGVTGGEAFVVGTSYTIGPVIAGASYVNYKSAGDITSSFLGRQRREIGIAAGATYAVAPGLSVFLSYLYQERKQNGFNFLTGQSASLAAPQGNAFNNKVTSNLLAVGTSFQW